MSTIRPIIHRERYTQLLETELVGFIDDVLLKPLRDLRDNAVEPDALLAAIAAGRVWHDGEGWRGVFSIAISKRIRELGGFSAPQSALPPAVREALTDARSRFSARKVALLGLLATIEGNVKAAEQPFPKAPVEIVVADAVGQFEEALEGVSEAPVPVGAVEQTAKEAVESLTGEQVKLVTDAAGRLRREVGRAENLPDLDDRIGIVAESTRRRAELVADQKASELVAEIRETLGVAAGFEEYEWVTMGDSRVRHDHKALNGRIFRFDNPPVVDTATGRRANPGEDHNCRCFAKLVIRN